MSPFQLHKSPASHLDTEPDCRSTPELHRADFLSSRNQEEALNFRSRDMKNPKDRFHIDPLISNVLERSDKNSPTMLLPLQSTSLAPQLVQPYLLSRLLPVRRKSIWLLCWSSRSFLAGRANKLLPLLPLHRGLGRTVRNSSDQSGFDERYVCPPSRKNGSENRLAGQI